MNTYIVKIPETVSVARLERAIARLSGTVPPNVETCERCKGSGTQAPSGMWSDQCYTCHGRGFNWIDFEITPYPASSTLVSRERAGAEPQAERSSGS